MNEDAEKHLQEVERCLTYDIRRDGYDVKNNMGETIYRNTSAFLNKGISINLEDKRVSEDHLIKELIKFFVELSNENHENDTGLVEAFENQKGSFLSSQFNVDLSTYRFVFPLNIRDGEHLSSGIDGKIEKIDHRRWEGDYLDIAIEEDESHLEEFLEESPNKLEKHGAPNPVFTFWTTTYEAREPQYALEKVIDRLRLTLSELNYTFYKGTVNRSSSSSKPPIAQLSALQEPYFYLIFDESDYIRYHPMDYDFRRRPITLSPDTLEALKDLPSLSIEDLPQNDEERTVDEALIEALFAYQDGMVASNSRQSFFAFWRGMENLTQADRGEKDEIVGRARAVHELLEDPAVWQGIIEAFDEIGDKRNKVAHEGPHVSVATSHQAAAKILLESLFDLYFDRYGCNYSIGDYRIFLQQLENQSREEADDLEQKKREVKIIEDMREYRQEKR